MTAIAIIPCRSGSKGFPGKNITKINDLTLIEYAVRVAKQTQSIDDVYVSTDSKEYEDIAISAGAKSLGLRPSHLATDGAKSMDVVLDFLKTLDKTFDHVVLLQPTSPMRSGREIEEMIRLLDNYNAAVTVERVDEPHPYKMMVIEDHKLKPFIRDAVAERPRQEMPAVYRLNGAIYCIRMKCLLAEKTFFPKDTYGYVTSRKINIDSEDDYLLLKELVRLNKINLP